MKELDAQSEEEEEEASDGDESSESSADTRDLPSRERSEKLPAGGITKRPGLRVSSCLCGAVLGGAPVVSCWSSAASPGWSPC